VAVTGLVIKGSARPLSARSIAVGDTQVCRFCPAHRSNLIVRPEDAGRVHCPCPQLFVRRRPWAPRRWPHSGRRRRARNYRNSRSESHVGSRKLRMLRDRRRRTSSSFARRCESVEELRVCLARSRSLTLAADQPARTRRAYCFPQTYAVVECRGPDLANTSTGSSPANTGTALPVLLGTGRGRTSWPILPSFLQGLRIWPARSQPIPIFVHLLSFSDSGGASLKGFSFRVKSQNQRSSFDLRPIQPSPRFSSGSFIDRRSRKRTR